MANRITLVLSLCSLFLSAPLGAQAPSKSSEVLTNQVVIQMVLAKLPKEVLLAKIQSSKNEFDLTTAGLVSLHANKVPVEIMKVMLATGTKKSSSEVLTNELVIQMVTAKLPKDVMLAKIQSSKTNFDITSAGLMSLNSNKVPKDVLKVMLAGG